MTPEERLLAAADFLADRRMCGADSDCRNCTLDELQGRVFRAEAERLQRTQHLRAFGGALLFKPQPDLLALADLLLEAS